MKITNRLNLPNALVRAVASVLGDYDPGDGDFTVTELIGPARLSALRKTYSEQIVVDVADYVYAALGSAFHLLMHRSERMGVSEQRVYMDFEGTKISGQFDLLHLNDTGLLQDWKTTTVYAVTKGTKFEWTAQLNLLDMILTANGHYVKELEIVPVFRDWMKSRARRAGTDDEANYPQTQAIRLPVERWPAAKKEEFLRERIAAHRAARAGVLPLCTNEERWIRDAAFAVKKKGNKTAMRGGVFKGPDAKELAEALAAITPGAFVEKRPGEATRCLDWCPVASWCSQWQADMKGEAA